VIHVDVFELEGLEALSQLKMKDPGSKPSLTSCRPFVSSVTSHHHKRKITIPSSITGKAALKAAQSSVRFPKARFYQRSTLGRRASARVVSTCELSHIFATDSTQRFITSTRFKANPQTRLISQRYQLWQSALCHDLHSERLFSLFARLSHRQDLTVSGALSVLYTTTTTLVVFPRCVSSDNLH